MRSYTDKCGQCKIATSYVCSVIPNQKGKAKDKPTRKQIHKEKKWKIMEDEQKIIEINRY